MHHENLSLELKLRCESYKRRLHIDFIFTSVFLVLLPTKSIMTYIYITSTLSKLVATHVSQVAVIALKPCHMKTLNYRCVIKKIDHLTPK